MKFEFYDHHFHEVIRIRMFKYHIPHSYSKKYNKDKNAQRKIMIIVIIIIKKCGKYARQ